MTIMQENFPLVNLQGVALCLAQKNHSSLSDVIKRLFGSLSNGFDNAPLTHNVRSATIAGCFYVLYSSGENVEGVTEFLLKILKRLPLMRWIDDAAVNKSDSKFALNGFNICSYFQKLPSMSTSYSPSILDCLT